MVQNIEIAMWLVVAAMVMGFLIYHILTREKRAEIKALVEKQRAEYVPREKQINIITKSCLIETEITYDIFEIKFKKQDEYIVYLLLNSNKKILKNRITNHYRKEEIVSVSNRDGFKFSCSYDRRCCVHWNVTSTDEVYRNPDELIDICTVYVGDEAIQQFEDELELKKIEDRLRRKQHLKELEEIAKQRIKDEIGGYRNN